MMNKVRSENFQFAIILCIVAVGFMGGPIAYPIFAPLFLHPSHIAIIPAIWNENTRAIFLGITLAAYPLGLFIGSPILGSWSDRYGRKPILIFTLIGGLLGYLLSAIALHFNLLWTLIVSRLITGIMEGNFAIVRAMAIDLHGINKYKSLGHINSISAISYVIGPLLGGFFSDSRLVSWFSFPLPFYLATFFAAITTVFAFFFLKESEHEMNQQPLSLWQQFNLIGRIKAVLQNDSLKYLLLLSTAFTLAIDIFFEFGPVYLTGRWLMSPAKIAIYNAILSVSLAIGSGWLTHRLTKISPVKSIIVAAMVLSSIYFGLIINSSQMMVLILFGLVGLSIAVANTSLLVQISDIAPRTIQGEVMGTQLSFRMLGDAVICLIGGVLIISSYALPLIFSCLIAFIAAGMYAIKFYFFKNKTYFSS